MSRVIDTLALLLAVLAVWYAAFYAAGDSAISAPGVTIAFAIRLISTADFWNHADATLLAFAYALVISAVAGIALGLALGLHRFSGEVAEPILASLYTIPKVTLYPLMLLVFGLGLSAKVAFGVIHGMIPVVLFTLAAVKNVPAVLLRTARVLRLRPAETARTVLMPAVLPEIITGLRIGFALTFLGVLIGEMFASQRGLGFLIINGINQHDVLRTTAVIVIVIAAAMVSNGALLALDRHARHGA
jgi:NitT/TauT family transport system permease protein